MANENVVFRRGPSSSIPQQKVPGTLLIETDTGNAFVDDTTENRVQLTDTRKQDDLGLIKELYNTNLWIHPSDSTHTLNLYAGTDQDVTGSIQISTGTTINSKITYNASIHDFSNGTLKNVASPKDNADGVNKSYVDTAFIELETEIVNTAAASLPLKGGTMTGDIDLDGHLLLNIGTPEADSDAATKGYVDTEIDSLSTSVGQQYLKLAGGTMTGDVSMGGSKVTATYTPSDNADLTNKEYVDNQINEKIQASDAMIFKGTIGSTGATVTQLPTSGYKTGWTYRVITEGTYAGKACEVGDMLIALNDGPASGSDVIDADWVDVQGNIDGAVIAPHNLTSNQLVVGSNGEDEVKTLAAGVNGQVLKVVDGTPTWSTHTGGSSTQPIYLDSTGDPTPISYTIQSSVPANAKFTDTTYSSMQGASASSAGVAGLVPAPSSGQQNMYLRGDGTWATPVSEGIVVPEPPGAGYILVSTATGCQWTQAFPYSVVIDDNATS